MSLNVERVTLAHAVLLPAKLAEAVGDPAVPIITWEAVRGAYADVDQQYLHAVLTTALDRPTWSAGGPATSRANSPV